MSANRKRKLNVWFHNISRCYLCDISLTIDEMTIDHMIPKSKGGGGKYNLRPCCLKCNRLKADKTLVELKIIRDLEEV